MKKKVRYVKHKSTGKISVVSPDRAKLMVGDGTQGYRYASSLNYHRKLRSERKKKNKEQNIARRKAA